MPLLSSFDPERFNARVLAELWIEIQGQRLLGQPDFTQSLSDLLDSFQMLLDRLKARDIIR